MRPTLAVMILVLLAPNSLSGAQAGDPTAVVSITGHGAGWVMFKVHLEGATRIVERYTLHRHGGPAFLTVFTQGPHGSGSSELAALGGKDPYFHVATSLGPGLQRSALATQKGDDTGEMSADSTCVNCTIDEDLTIVAVASGDAADWSLSWATDSGTAVIIRSGTSGTFGRTTIDFGNGPLAAKLASTEITINGTLVLHNDGILLAAAWPAFGPGDLADSFSVSGPRGDDACPCFFTDTAGTNVATPGDYTFQLTHVGASGVATLAGAIIPA